MSIQPLEDHTELIQICECIFKTGEYLPSTVAEAEWLLSFGFEQKGSALVLPAGIEYLDQECIEQTVRNIGVTSNLPRIQLKNCVESTNLELLKATGDDGVSGKVVLAEMQVAGRGRFGRDWHSPVGRNLAISLGARLARTPDDLGAISLVVGVAVASAIRELGIDVVALKWPNDILLHNRKVGGILVDVVRATTPIDIVVGIGLNVGGGASTEKFIDRPVADLLDYCVLPIRNILAGSIVRNVYDSVYTFENSGFMTFHENWHALDALRDQSVRVSTSDKEIRGIARGVRDAGELCIELKDGEIHYVNAGEVSLEYT
ncbi:MAG: biotin--[acetyl-CoA-carboxylase] ligase [Gammaproteobacteria bacterium]|nr:biotin--[acetyl-CoA-carboxylase] ligase [Gammaproteobacteria bacterium]MYF02036.1 biotin--[acetyl-CoA-carboxylase] ligase [Gammaproteobacteria bacterium]MYI77651.1 biotin--[acetyl-CoA-carboxylase] ligase [Gammaproteobacteria bacterium]